MSGTERSYSDPIEGYDWEEFQRDVDATRFRAEQQRSPEDSVSQNKIYTVACAFLAILIIVIVLAILFSMANM